MQRDVICTTDNEVTSGVVTFWRLSGSINLTQLVEEWDDRGWDGDLLPSTTGENVALRRAVAELYQTKGTIVRPFRNKSAVMDSGVEEAEEGVIQPLYKTRFTVWLDDDGIPQTHPSISNEERNALLRQFNVVTNRIDEELSSWFAKVVFSLGGVALRDSGGVYFVPRRDPNISFTWDAFTEVVQKLSACRIYRIPAMDSASATQAILDSLTDEITKAENGMRVTLDEHQLGRRALETRTKRVSELFNKVSAYETMFGESLDTLRSGLQVLEARLVESLLVASREEEV